MCVRGSIFYYYYGLLDRNSYRYYSIVLNVVVVVVVVVAVAAIAFIRMPPLYSRYTHCLLGDIDIFDACCQAEKSKHSHTYSRKALHVSNFPNIYTYAKIFYTS